MTGLTFLLACLSVHSQTQEISINPSSKIIESKFSISLRHLLDQTIDNHLIKVEIQTPDVLKMTELSNSVKATILFNTNSGPLDYLVCALTKKQLLILSEHKEFLAAENIRQPFTELKQEGCDFTLNQINYLHHSRQDLNGTGLTLSIKENSFDTADIDFHNRYLITPLTPASINLHSTNMASISAGGGISDLTALGVASDATITSSNFDFLLPDEDEYFKDFQITVQNHSYGTGIENYYGMETEAYDESCMRLPEVMHIFSSGNIGNQTPTEGTYAGLKGWSNITGQFKQSKNTLTVGALDSMGNVMPLSSKGPAFDGRIKPEVVAYGHGGTSGAAALVSGLSILLQDEFKRTHADSLPPSSLIKAILANTALDVGRPGPDFENGFGSVRGDDADKAIEENRILEDKVVKGEMKSYPFLIPEGIRQVKITMAWNDPPASINAPNALINDLDLELANMTTGEIWHPWILSIFPNSDSLILPARRGIDTINNIEQITLSFPVTGAYEIRVKGNKIRSEAQDFSLTWQLDVDHIFEWSFPTSSDYLMPGKKNIPRWNAASDENGKLEYKYVDQDDWQLVTEQADPSIGWVNWNTPSTSGLMQLRWTDIDTSFVSDTFVVADLLKPKVGFYCPDSLLFYWDRDPRADSFEIFRLGERHLEHKAFTSDTFYISYDLNDDGFHYAVAPVYGRYSNPRSYGFDYRQQGAGCYINEFYLKEIMDGKAYLEADLGSLYNVSGLMLEKLEGDIYIPIVSLSPVEELNHVLESDQLKQGLNYFRLSVIFNNGLSVSSDDLAVYYLSEHGMLVFPNPVNTNQEVNILSRSYESFNLKIIDDLGRVLIDRDETNNPQEVSIKNLVPGHYIAVIYYESGGMEAEGFIVRE